MKKKIFRPPTKSISKNLNNFDFEVIFVDDNSDDNSKKILQKLKN